MVLDIEEDDEEVINRFQLSIRARIFVLQALLLGLILVTANIGVMTSSQGQIGSVDDSPNLTDTNQTPREINTENFTGDIGDTEEDLPVIIFLEEPGEHEPVWSRVYENRGKFKPHAIVESGDGGFVLTGDMGLDAFFMKIDSDGNEVWKKIYGGNYSDFANDVIPTQDGSFIVAGSSCTGSECSVADQGYVVKVAGNGSILWEKTYEGSIKRVAGSSENGYLMTGDKLTRIDDAGNVIWTRDYEGLGHVIDVDGGENFVFVIPRESISKIDLEGRHIWNCSMREGSVVRCLVEAQDGAIIAAGYLEGHGYLMKIDPAGVKVWEKTYQGNGSEFFYSVDTTSDGGLVTAGSTCSFGEGFFDVHVTRLNPDGELLWHSNYGLGDDWGWDISSAGNRFIVAAETGDLSPDVYLLCFSEE